MALPPGFLDDLRARLTLSDIAGRKVMWDQRKSMPAKGDFWAPCPFHQEKTPSFHVDDRKGFYYCFGCHAKGDMITFVKETENLSFIEAVERLATEAGLEMPRETRDPRAAEKRDRAQRLADVMEQAVRAFGLALRSAQGAPVRAYIEGRGLSPETVKRFELGFAPDARQHLTAHFREKGQLDEAIAAGLVIRGDDGSVYDRFRGRLMFPIRDGRGRCIAFGGRAMADGARAKYLNSPETELFHKSRVLYNEAPAREAAGKAGALIVAEGYMDVIALAQAGFDHAVAPLGTAITEDQVRLMWRMADEPVIALDGDRAGLQAAERLVDLALPLLAPGKSLGFCLMPEGQDPDDLLRAQGPAGMQAALADALPLIEMLWRRETAEPHDTPERWAALKSRLRAATRRIADPDVRQAYGERLAERLADLRRPPPRPPAVGGAGSAGQGAFGQGAFGQGAFGQGSFGSGSGTGARPGGGRTGRWPRGPQPPLATTLASLLSRPTSQQSAARIREAGILAGVLLHPAVVPEIEDALEEMRILSPDLAALRDALVALAGSDDLPACLAARLGEDPLPALTRVAHLRMHPLGRKGLAPAHVADVTRDAIARHEAILTSEVELAEARRDLADADDESWTRRVERVSAERRAADTDATRRELEAAESTGESIFQKMLDARPWERPGRGRGGAG